MSNKGIHDRLLVLHNKTLTDFLQIAKDLFSSVPVTHVLHVAYIEVTPSLRGFGYSKILLSHLFLKYSESNLMILLEPNIESIRNFSEFYKKQIIETFDNVDLKTISKDNSLFIVGYKP